MPTRGWRYRGFLGTRRQVFEPSVFDVGPLTSSTPSRGGSIGVSSRPKSLHLLATHIADTPTELIPELSTAVEQMLERTDLAWSLTNFEAIAR
jgi:hypothetical protein